MKLTTEMLQGVEDAAYADIADAATTKGTQAKLLSLVQNCAAVRAIRMAEKVKADAAAKVAAAKK